MIKDHRRGLGSGGGAHAGGLRLIISSISGDCMKAGSCSNGSLFSPTYKVGYWSRLSLLKCITAVRYPIFVNPSASVSDSWTYFPPRGVATESPSFIALTSAMLNAGQHRVPFGPIRNWSASQPTDRRADASLNSNLSGSSPQCKTTFTGNSVERPISPLSFESCSLVISRGDRASKTPRCHLLMASMPERSLDRLDCNPSSSLDRDVSAKFAVCTDIPMSAACAAAVVAILLSAASARAKDAIFSSEICCSRPSIPIALCSKYHSPQHPTAISNVAKNNTARFSRVISLLNKSKSAISTITPKNTAIVDRSSQRFSLSSAAFRPETSGLSIRYFNPSSAFRVQSTVIEIAGVLIVGMNLIQLFRTK